MPAGWVSAAVGVVGALSAATKNDQPAGQTTETTTKTLDPRMQSMLYGSGRKLRNGVTATYGPDVAGTQRLVQDFDPLGGAGGYHLEGTAPSRGLQTNPDSDFDNDPGVLGRINGLLDKPQMSGSRGYGESMDRYIGSNLGNDVTGAMQSAQRLQNSNYNAPGMTGAQINAPGQNGTDLTQAYNDMIYGDSAENPYLTGAIQSGINQSGNAFADMQADATRNLVNNILPNIRGGAEAAGQYGGSRQGIAEGTAVGQFGTDMARAAGRFGQHNTDAAVTAQANEFGQGQNRALNAMGGLSGNQFNVAGQNAGFNQQAGANNQQAQISTNQLNSANQQGGISAVNGLASTIYGAGQNQDQYDANRIGKVSGLLSNFTGLGGGTSQSTPYYSNSAGNMAGGASMGMGLLKAYNKAGGNAVNTDGSPNYNNYTAQSGNPYSGYNAAANGGWGIE